MKTRIPIKKYEDDPSLPWPERYRRLEAHHLEETTFLIARIGELEPESSSSSTEDPEFPTVAWKREVADDGTQLGYREWVARRKASLLQGAATRSGAP